MDTLNNQENIETYNEGTESTKVAEDKEFYERYYQAKLEYNVIKAFYVNCFNKYKIIFSLGIISLVLIILSLLSVISLYFIIFAIIIIGVCVWLDEYTDKHILSEPINDEYLNKVHQQIQEQLLSQNNIHLNESNDSFNQKINTFIKNFLKKEERPITYQDIIKLYENHRRQFYLIEKEFQHKSDMSKQSESIDKYFG